MLILQKGPLESKAYIPPSPHNVPFLPLKTQVLLFSQVHRPVAVTRFTTFYLLLFHLVLLKI